MTKRGVKTAVLLPIDGWRRYRKTAQGKLKALLLSPKARTEALDSPCVRPAFHLYWNLSKLSYLLDINIVHSLFWIFVFKEVG